jgi:hypothetical protein
VDGLLIDGCALAALTGGLYGGGGGTGFSILDCQCAGGNPFPLACAPSADACPMDGGNATGSDAWPWATGVAGDRWQRCACPARPWDTLSLHEGGGRLRPVPWHSLSEELLEEALRLDSQWQVHVQVVAVDARGSCVTCTVHGAESH